MIKLNYDVNCNNIEYRAITSTIDIAYSENLSPLNSHTNYIGHIDINYWDIVIILQFYQANGFQKINIELYYHFL